MSGAAAKASLHVRWHSTSGGRTGGEGLLLPACAAPQSGALWEPVPIRRGGSSGACSAESVCSVAGSCAPERWWADDGRSWEVKELRRNVGDLRDLGQGSWWRGEPCFDPGRAPVAGTTRQRLLAGAGEEVMRAAGALWREKNPMRRGGANRRMVHLLAMLWLAAPGTSSGPEGCVPQNLRCYKSCCDTPFHCLVNCTWDAGRTSDANYTLNFGYTKERKSFEAGSATSLLLNQDQLFALRNVTIWVESREGDGALSASSNLTLQISEAVRFSATSAKDIAFSRSNHVLTLTWPDPETCSGLPRKREARMRPVEAAEWRLGNCSSADDRDGKEPKLGVACRLDTNVPYEAQVRYRTDHWSSYWSDWSESVLVPAEILSSPKVNYTVQRLGRDGRRNVTLEWESLGKEHGSVTYLLTFALLPCRLCQDLEMERIVPNRTLCQVALSGAGYEVSVEAINAAGASPARPFQIPPERDAGPNFLNIRRSGGNLTLKWEAKVSAGIFCVEKQALGEAVEETPCSEKHLAASSAHESSVSVSPNKCYRLAVHGRGWSTGISTFGLAYLFHRQPSLEGRIPVNVTNATTHSAAIQWEPPGVLSNCPGVLEKYVICCRSEADSKITNYEANTSETRFTIPDLQPKTAYHVGVWASTPETKQSCEAHVRFVTKPPDPKKMTLAHIFLFLGVFLGILAAACIFHYGKKRVTDVFCPPLLDPANIEALKVLTMMDSGQVRLQQGFIELQESGGLPESFIVEPPPDKEDPAADTSVDVPEVATAAEEPSSPAEDDQGVSCDIPPSSEYKGQGLLSPMEDERFGGSAGGSQEAGASGCPLPSPPGAEAGEGESLPLPHTPLSFMLMDKVVVIKNGDGDFGFLHHRDALT